MINIIVAMDKNGLIGRSGSLPWHLPSDLRFFRDTTLGQIVVMGSKTYASLGKPLPNRINMVLSRNNGCTMQRVLDLAEGNDIFVIGGANVYEQFMPIADRLIITHIDAEFEGDTYFPLRLLNPFEFTMIDSRKGFDEFAQLGFEINIYKRISGGQN